MTNIDSDGLRLFMQDLSVITPSADDDGRIYLHDGTTVLTLASGETDSARGYYTWDNTAGAWARLASDAATLDGMDSSDFVSVAGDTMTGALDTGGNALKDSASTQTIWDAVNGWIPDSALETAPSSGGNHDEILVGSVTDVTNGVADYSEIQAAHDALPADGAGQVRVLEGYGNTDTFPIVWNKRAGLVSNGTKRIGDTTNDLDRILEVNFAVAGGSDPHNRPPGPYFRDLQFNGGLDCVLIVNTRFSTWNNVHFTNAANDGIKIDYAAGPVNSHTFFNCTSEKNGRDGFWSSPQAYACEFYGCTGQANGRHGIRLNNNASSRIIGGAWQINDDAGIYVSAMESCTIRDAYIESNCEVSGNSEILVGAAGTPMQGLIIEGNYINNQLGTRTRDYAIIIEDATRSLIRGNTLRTDATMLAQVQILAGTDNDVYESSHNDVTGNDTPTITASSDSGTRTRSDSIIGKQVGGVSLAGVTGQAPGDRGMDSDTTVKTWDGASWLTANNVKPGERSTLPAFVAHKNGGQLIDPADITLTSGVTATTVADPFIVYEDGTFYLFYEAKETTTPEQNIHYQTSTDGVNFTEQGEVLNTTGNLSYPLVFKDGGTWYMLPDDTTAANERSLYSTTTFPTGWTKEHTWTGVGDVKMSDTTMFQYEDVWYLSYADEDGLGNEIVQLEYSDTIPTSAAGWTRHPSSPLTAAADNLRPGGRPIVYQDTVYQPLQKEVDGVYGAELHFYQLEGLTPSGVTHTSIDANPVLQGQGGTESWNAVRMHHFDCVMGESGEIDTAIVDGGTGSGSWSVGIMSPSSFEPVVTRAGLATGPSIANGGTATLDLGKIQVDTHGAVDTTADTWTCPVTGWYEVSAQIGFSYSGTSNGRVTVDFMDRAAATRVVRTNANAITGITYQSLDLAPRFVRLEEGTAYGVDVINASGASVDLSSGEDQSALLIKRLASR